MNPRISGFEPETGICWQFSNKGDRPFCDCPACSRKEPNSLSQHQQVIFGRVRSGNRWFWSVNGYGYDMENTDAYGWEDSEEAATATAIARIRELKTRPWMTVFFKQIQAVHRLHELNQVKLRERLPPETDDAADLGFLYAAHGGHKYRIVKRTAKRVYYERKTIRIPGLDPYPSIRGHEDFDETIGYVDREILERDGAARKLPIEKYAGWFSDDRLYREPPRQSLEVEQ